MEKTLAIGLMSGTSLDGLDICYSSFHKNKNNIWHFEIIKAETLEYSKKWEKKLREAIHLKSEDLLALHSEYGFYLGECVQKFIKQNNLKKIDVIASHGHTVFHQPERKFTLQIGDGRAIKIINQIPTVYGFRSQDVLMNGNGAPLVPIGDELLFSEYAACLNIGGFSNISLKENNQRIAFDICPVNIVLNDFAKKLGQNFDKNGELAKNGIVNEKALKQLNSLKYYSQKIPKSLGIEWVIKEVSPILKKLNPQEALATFTEHSAEKIAETLNHYQSENVLITGGGAYNQFLIERIKAKTKTSIIIPNNDLVEYKEALVFALMGVLRTQNENNVIASATGSSEDHCSGIYIV
ncbi:MAG: anhydro-N-acetylmuramic acid kinase [Cruoricaptor ignavus]|nr:anhydro-N-acetylmuramic acid kinase [Cruoricaptor ignavus]